MRSRVSQYRSNALSLGIFILLPAKPTTFYFQSMSFDLGWHKSKLSWSLHFSLSLPICPHVCVSVLSSVGLFCLSLCLPLFHFSLSALVPLSHLSIYHQCISQKTGRAAIKYQKVNSVSTFLHNHVDTFIRVMWPGRIPVRPLPGHPHWNPTKLKTNETHFHQSNGWSSTWNLSGVQRLKRLWDTLLCYYLWQYIGNLLE